MGNPGDNNVPLYPQIMVIPERDEKRDIRKRYTKIGLVLFVNIILFNYVLTGIIMLCCGIYMKDISIEGIKSGINLLYANSVFTTAVSVCIPIISETLSIIIGIKAFKIDIKGMFSRAKYNSGTIWKLVVLCLGLQTISSFISVIVSLLLDVYGITVNLPDFTAKYDSAAANIILYTYAGIIGPVLEELLYRGFLLQSLRKYNERMAVFVTALIFGFMHQNYQQFILGLLIGIPLAVVTIKCGSIIPAIIAHVIVNTSNVLLSLLMAFISPSEYDMFLSGNIDITNISPGMTGMVIINFIWRIGFMVAALVIGIITLAKGGNMSKPTLAGKNRGFKILSKSWAWILIFGFYLFVNFIQPVLFSQ